MSRSRRHTGRAAPALLACLLMVVLAPTAHAWRELPAYDVPGGGVADCLRPGGPDQAALLERLPPTSAPTTLLDVAAGIAPRTPIPLGRLRECAEVAAADGATPLLAGWTTVPGKRSSSALRVAEAGRLPATLYVTTQTIVSAPAVAVAPNGAAVIAWSETTLNFARLFDTRARVLAAVRPPGGASFGPIAVLDANGASTPVVGIDDAGDATVAWMGDASTPASGNQLASADVASAPAGGRFAAPQALVRSSGDAIALAVAANGRALVAADAGDLTGAWERPAATGSFSALALPDLESPEELAVALRPDGAAALVARSNNLTATLRQPGGAFGPAQQLLGDTSSPNSIPYFLAALAGSSSSGDESGPDVHVAIGPARDVVISWIEGASGVAAAAVHVAHGTLGGRLALVRLGTPCRTAEATTPLVLRDGRLGVAWTDNARVTSVEGVDEPRGDGRLHVATPDPVVSRPPAPQPLISVRVLGPLALHAGQALRVRVRCRRGPCDVRAVAPAYTLGENGGDDVAASATVGAGRTATLRLVPTQRASFAKRRKPTRSAVALLACGMSRTATSRLTLHPVLRRLPPPPIPRVLQLRARRHGDAIHVTWRTSIPARSLDFYVLTRPIDLTSGFAERAGHGRTRFSATLHPQDAAHVRSVTVVVDAPDASAQPSTTVRVR
jgi:hypothetical protein